MLIHNFSYRYKRTTMVHTHESIVGFRNVRFRMKSQISYALPDEPVIPVTRGPASAAYVLLSGAAPVYSKTGQIPT